MGIAAILSLYFVSIILTSSNASLIQFKISSVCSGTNTETLGTVRNEEICYDLCVSKKGATNCEFIHFGKTGGTEQGSCTLRGSCTAFESSAQFDIYKQLPEPATRTTYLGGKVLSPAILKKGDVIWSKFKQYQLRVNSDGTVELLEGCCTSRWKSDKTNYDENAFIKFQNDGNLVGYSGSTHYWSTQWSTMRTDKAYLLQVREVGIIQVIDLTNNRMIWGAKGNNKQGDIVGYNVKGSRADYVCDFQNPFAKEGTSSTGGIFKIGPREGMAIAGSLVNAITGAMALLPPPAGPIIAAAGRMFSSLMKFANVLMGSGSAEPTPADMIADAKNEIGEAMVRLFSCNKDYVNNKLIQLTDDIMTQRVSRFQNGMTSVLSHYNSFKKETDTNIKYNYLENVFGNGGVFWDLKAETPGLTLLSEGVFAVKVLPLLRDAILFGHTAALEWNVICAEKSPAIVYNGKQVEKGLMYTTFNWDNMITDGKLLIERYIEYLPFAYHTLFGKDYLKKEGMQQAIDAWSVIYQPTIICVEIKLNKLFKPPESTTTLTYFTSDAAINTLLLSDDTCQDGVKKAFFSRVLKLKAMSSVLDMNTLTIAQALAPGKSVEVPITSDTSRPATKEIHISGGGYLADYMRYNFFGRKRGWQSIGNVQGIELSVFKGDDGILYSVNDECWWEDQNVGCTSGSVDGYKNTDAYKRKPYIQGLWGKTLYPIDVHGYRSSYDSPRFPIDSYAENCPSGYSMTGMRLMFQERDGCGGITSGRNSAQLAFHLFGFEFVCQNTKETRTIIEEHSSEIHTIGLTPGQQNTERQSYSDWFLCPYGHKINTVQVDGLDEADATCRFTKESLTRKRLAEVHWRYHIKATCTKFIVDPALSSRSDPINDNNWWLSRIHDNDDNNWWLSRSWMAFTTICTITFLCCCILFILGNISKQSNKAKYQTVQSIDIDDDHESEC